jgi:hypothetical protein
VVDFFDKDKLVGYHWISFLHYASCVVVIIAWFST